LAPFVVGEPATDVAFRTGPLLAGTTLHKDEAEEPAETVLTPTPATTVGSWTWTEKRASGDVELPILTLDQYDHPLAEPELRAGFLVLDNAATPTNDQVNR
jgi:hypothetical protein